MHTIREGIKGSAGPKRSGACEIGIAALSYTSGTIDITKIIKYFITAEFIAYFFFLEFFELLLSFACASTAAGALSAVCFLDFIIPQRIEAMQSEE